ncbi:MAG: hypothetical protein AMXMBFR53_43650 [Gemmatimonadota bacterium]
MEEWTTSTADLASGTASLVGAQDQASHGSRSVRVALENPGGAAKAWMTRELEVTPDQRYTVELAFDLRTTDATDDAWTLIVGVGPQAPAGPAALNYQGDTGAGAPAGGWAEKSATLTAQADDEGRLHLTLGVWGTTSGSRTYWIDNVRVVLTRA